MAEVFRHPFRAKLVKVEKWNKNQRSLFWHRKLYGFCRPGRISVVGIGTQTFQHLKQVW